MIRTVRAGWSPFRADLAASLRAMGSYPLIPLISAGLALLALLPEPWLWYTLPAAAVAVGWAGTERMLFLRSFRGLPLLRSELWPFTAAFIGRFLVLEIAVMVALSGVSLIYLMANDPGVHLLAIGLAFLIMDIFLTFVWPALAYSTRRVTIAVRIGHRMLLETWPASIWYVFVPPLVALAGLRLLPEAVAGVRGRVLLAAGVGLLNLWFRGAVAALYLRRHPATDDGAVHASSLETLDPATGEPRRPEP